MDGGLRDRLGALAGDTLRTATGHTFRVGTLDGRHLHVVGVTGWRGRIPLGALERAAAAARGGRPVAGQFNDQRARVLAVLRAAGVPAAG